MSVTGQSLCTSHTWALWQENVALQAEEESSPCRGLCAACSTHTGRRDEFAYSQMTSQADRGMADDVSIIHQFMGCTEKMEKCTPAVKIKSNRKQMKKNLNWTWKLRGKKKETNKPQQNKRCRHFSLDQLLAARAECSESELAELPENSIKSPHSCFSASHYYLTGAFQFHPPGKRGTVYRGSRTKFHYIESGNGHPAWFTAHPLFSK